MASSMGISDGNFKQLLSDFVDWYDSYGYISMLKVLYSDIVKDTGLLNDAVGTMDLMELLTASGDLQPNDLSLLYETIKATNTFGLENKIKHHIPSCPNIRNVIISKFTIYRQRVIRLGMALNKEDVRKISRLYTNPVKTYADRWGLIMDLEHRLILNEENMEEFINNLKKNGLGKAAKSLTEGVKVTLVGKRDSSEHEDQPKPKYVIDLLKEVCVYKGYLPVKDIPECWGLIKKIVRYYKNYGLTLDKIEEGSIVFHLSAIDSIALEHLWKIHLSKKLIKDLANLLVPEKHQQEFLDEWMTHIDETEYNTALKKLKERELQMEDDIKMATNELNQFPEDIDKEFIECAICLKRLQNPKSLNCQHSFCLACLEDWVTERHELTCPTCSRSYSIPEGGLQNLPSNTVLNKLLEALEQYGKKDQIMKCICGKAEEYYCQDCRINLCSACKDYHKLLPISENHKLHTVEDVRSMTPQDFALLNPPLCSLHSTSTLPLPLPLEFYCQDCKTPICLYCKLQHNEMGHKTIRISEAFQTFKETSETLVEAAHDCKNKLQGGIKAVIENGRKLKQSRDTVMRDIDYLVEDIIQRVKKNGNKIKNKAEAIYKEKKQVNDVQLGEIRTTISNVNTKLCFLNHLLNNDKATAMQSSECVIAALEKRISGIPKTEPKDNGQICFLTNTHYIDSFELSDIGEVETKMKALKRVASASQDQYNFPKVMKTVTDVDENPPAASADGEPFQQSPMIIKEKEQLVNTIQIYQKLKVFGLVFCEDDCFLISCGKNEMYKYGQSGKYTAKITLPNGVEIFSMYKMKNGNIAVSDEGRKKCVTIVKMNGEVIKSIGQGVLKDPAGIHVDEASNAVYVADWKQKCVFMFDIESGKKIREVKSPNKKQKIVHDVTLTNQGHILVLERDTKITSNNTLQLFDNEGNFMKVLVKGDEHGIRDFREVVVDDNDNIILISTKKIHHFYSDGSFIKRIDKPEDGITNLGGICLISQHPRRLAVVNNGDTTIKIYNY